MASRERSRSRGRDVDASTRAWLESLGATDEQIAAFSGREFKGQPLLAQWTKPMIRSKAVSLVRELSSRLPPPFNTVDAILARPALVDTTPIGRIVHNIGQLQALRPENYVDLISARPDLLMHPEGEFSLDETWTDWQGQLRSGGNKSQRKKQKQKQKKPRK
mmetsp:Transcript_25616/g.64509  ORF Transcript_25616/g.64509 Transcript_25616/m.64509 type:complete len:162 (-) Transcript_25616:107-592(-)